MTEHALVVGGGGSWLATRVLDVKAERPWVATASQSHPFGIRHGPRELARAGQREMRVEPSGDRWARCSMSERGQEHLDRLRLVTRFTPARALP